ncbi:hypothetical protein DFO70_107251 [Cytobacillus firmus]|uniref:Uncharacterized protein n=2 Tax=Cytobacillus TaxID=2675230 RepID=A0A366JV58_CYTFI|nr:hypothetical protein DFO70_107251 [Cytobacillus firmus]TDX41996.1 hypothetical protein DFO72_107158 [Cytobacillus oceanisediminis]
MSKSGGNFPPLFIYINKFQILNVDNCPAQRLPPPRGHKLVLRRFLGTRGHKPFPFRRKNTFLQEPSYVWRPWAPASTFRTIPQNGKERLSDRLDLCLWPPEWGHAYVATGRGVFSLRSSVGKALPLFCLSS